MCRSLLALGCLLVTAAFAARPIASVTASGGFRLSGVWIPDTAAASVPLSSGDRIETLSNAAIVLLPDTSRVTLSPNSRLQVRRRDARTRFCLEQGALQYRLAAGASVEFCALARQIVPDTPSAGFVSIDGPEKVQVQTELGSARVDENAPCRCDEKEPWLTRRKAVVIVAAAAGGGVGGAVAVTRRGPPFPPPGPPPVIPPRSPNGPPQ